MNHKKRIFERINQVGDFYAENTPTPLLTLEEFFEGNDIVGSIGCNLEGAPHPSALKSILSKINERPDVHEVFIQITEMDDPDWPFSDTAWIVTTASENEILEYFPERFAPDDLWEGFNEGQVYETITIPYGYKVLACWWD